MLYLGFFCIFETHLTKEREKDMNNSIILNTSKVSEVIRTAGKTIEVIYSMLIENTGTHGMDSGGDSGRHWQAHQEST